jgi:hypothetical protein
MGNRAVFTPPSGSYAASHCSNGPDATMHRYLVERTFPPGSPSIASAPGGPPLPAFIAAHDSGGVVWLLTYLTPDLRRSYCIVDGPSPQAVRDAARTCGLPVDRISEVWVLERGPDQTPATPTSDVSKEFP